MYSPGRFQKDKSPILSLRGDGICYAERGLSEGTPVVKGMDGWWWGFTSCKHQSPDTNGNTGSLRTPPAPTAPAWATFPPPPRRSHRLLRCSPRPLITPIVTVKKRLHRAAQHDGSPPIPHLQFSGRHSKRNDREGTLCLDPTRNVKENSHHPTSAYPPTSCQAVCFTG